MYAWVFYAEGSNSIIEFSKCNGDYWLYTAEDSQGNLVGRLTLLHPYQWYGLTLIGDL